MALESDMTYLKRYLIAGLLVWLPLGVTIAVIKFLVDLFDRSLLLLPLQYRPETLLGMDIPGLGILLSFLLILFTGVLAANLLGSKLVSIWEAFLSRIPLVRSIYKAVKQIAEALFGSGEQTFQNVFLIEYPRKGLWTLAFQTGKNISEPQRKTGMPQVVNLFVPTTPNPTSGFFIMADRSEIIKLDMDVDDALKMVISGGVVAPDEKRKALAVNVTDSASSTDKQ
ncbi:membrane protein [Thiosulfatimonas sediminis]|uniref:Membrane protein n=2 Tax=Thiosulfatimonas sediminis TaxID=2675054 RepID=A0A6F8PU95_9GAMM|nr:membrane protein [Thiosulfatimonas sediminis]